jgi:NAD(P)-dependent dehydrogenase (short-subunit alcohol dehydrogenase family)
MNGNIVVFGGSGGLGKPLCEQLVSLYPDVIVHPVSSKDVNITDEESIKAYLGLNKPAVVINLAIVNVDGLLHKRDAESLKKQLDVSVTGSVNIFRHAIPFMRENNYGRLIYISSILSRKPIMGTSIYSASKAFNDNLIRTVALENAKYHVTANSIQLGYFEGGLTERVPEPIIKQVMEQIPLKRLGRIDELANAIKFIIDTEYVTGGNLTMAGGLEC